jgi:hypothetical protein
VGHGDARARGAAEPKARRLILFVTPPSAGAAFGRIHDGRRDDDTTFYTLAPSARFTKNTKLTKAHKEKPVSLFDGLQLLTPPRFARWQE